MVIPKTISRKIVLPVKAPSSRVDSRSRETTEVAKQGDCDDDTDV